jgi:hypothetical protein
MRLSNKKVNEVMDAIKWQAYNAYMAEHCYGDAEAGKRRDQELAGMVKMAELFGVDSTETASASRDGRVMAKDTMKAIEKERGEKAQADSKEWNAWADRMFGVFV